MGRSGYCICRPASRIAQASVAVVKALAFDKDIHFFRGIKRHI
jgi:hypothetical protein